LAARAARGHAPIAFHIRASPAFSTFLALSQEIFASFTVAQVELRPPSTRGQTLENANFSARIRQAGPVSLLEISGRLTSFEVGALRDSIARLLKQDRKDIVLNLSGLQYLDSSGIGELARLYVTVVKHGGQVKVIGLSSKVEEILKITKLYQVFPEFPDEEAALRSFPQTREEK
jgi:anti-sigma B factor antagonist